MGNINCTKLVHKSIHILGKEWSRFLTQETFGDSRRPLGWQAKHSNHCCPKSKYFACLLYKSVPYNTECNSSSIYFSFLGSLEIFMRLWNTYRNIQDPFVIKSKSWNLLVNTICCWKISRRLFPYTKSC